MLYLILKGCSQSFYDEPCIISDQKRTTSQRNGPKMASLEKCSLKEILKNIMFPCRIVFFRNKQRRSEFSDFLKKTEQLETHVRKMNC